MRLLQVAVALLCTVPAQGQQPAPSSSAPLFKLEEVMIPVRDGIHLQTVILTPVNQSGPLPILFTRTPYGVPSKAPSRIPNSFKELVQDGYIFVFQNLRGRFKSEGVFKLSSWVDLSDSTATNETTDAYDRIDWLVKHVANNNGNVGMYGVSYDGLTTALAMLKPHPALKAVSEQAAPVDQWMNDDMHRYGALRESYAFEYSVLEQADKNPEHQLRLRRLRFIQLVSRSRSALQRECEVPQEQDSLLERHCRAPRLRRLLETRSMDSPAACDHGAQSQRGWILGSGGSLGALAIFHHAEEHDPEQVNFIVAGPWFPGEWESSKADSIGLISFGGHDTAREFREEIHAPFFRYYLHGKGEKPSWQARTFQSGSNSWKSYDAWPPKNAEPRKLYLLADGSLSFAAPKAGSSGSRAYREYISIPPTRCPIGSGRSRPRIQAVIGEPGRLPTSGSWTAGRTSSPM